MKKVVIYLRVSDQMQEEKDSLTKQEQQAIDYCKFKNYNIYKIIKEVGSGRKDDREGFIELENEIKKNTFDVLIFYELSRLARNTYVLHKLIHNMRQKKIQFESITESYLNSDSPTSKLMLSVLASQAEIESDMISKRVKNRMRHYTAEGYWVFQPPRGYRLENKILYIIEEEAEMVRDIYRDFLAGASYAELCRNYNTSNPGIKRILTNVAYIGKTKFGFEGKDKDTGKRVQNLPGEIFEGKHEPIIDLDIFNAVQEVIRHHTLKNMRITKTEYLLTGLIRHNNCTHRMYGKVNRAANYKYYQCSSCAFSMSLEKIESIVIDNLKEYSKGLKTLNNSRAKKMNRTNKLDKYFSKRKRIIEAYTDGHLPREEYLNAVQTINKKIKEIEDTEKQPEKVEVNTNYDKLIKIVKKFEELGLQEKKALLKMFIDEVIIVDRMTIEVVYKI
ncbi:serine recombinase [Propionigenium maris DSM 9537]|uniref:Serine recombinase n=1 Tax=Propionigenium maris DSM 9537 TaxID=1123000 RepID=A0A9W6LMA9_9FUSO|nr:recombinase family protein [Propionigenium maris]GLI54725.1 serine recombinase [Propionigenium maris DSM 9537]